VIGVAVPGMHQNTDRTTSSSSGVSKIPTSVSKISSGTPLSGFVTSGHVECHVVGADVGKDVGSAVGAPVGKDVGSVVGMPVGEDVGSVVGMPVGEYVGAAVGTAVPHKMVQVTSCKVCSTLPASKPLGAEITYSIWSA